MTKKETDYLPLWEPLDRAKEAPVKKELTKAEEAEKKRKQRETEAFKKKIFRVLRRRQDFSQRGLVKTLCRFF